MATGFATQAEKAGRAYGPGVHLRAGLLLAAAAAFLILWSGGAWAQDADRPGGGAPPRELPMAGACAFAPMAAAERLDICNQLLAQPDLADPVRALANLGRSEALRQTGDPAAALEAVNETIRLAPSLAAGFLSRGATRIALDDIQGAIADASQAIELQRGSPAGYALRAEAYLMDNAAAFAVGDMDEAIAIAPRAPRLRILRAYAHMALGRPGDALLDARAALKEDPEMVAAYLVRARIYLSEGAFSRAAADAERAADLAPTDRMALDTAAVAFTETARLDDALAKAEALVALEPESADALNAKCWVLALKPDPEAALPSCNAALESDDRHYQAYDSRALVYWQLGRLEESRADLARAAEIQPDFWDWDRREARFSVVLARRYLKRLGHYKGPTDGDFDDMTETETALAAYRAAEGLPPGSGVDDALLKRLERQAAAME